MFRVIQLIYEKLSANDTETQIMHRPIKLKEADQINVYSF